MEKIKLCFIANSGILADTGTCRLLVDGIYGKNPHFTPPRKEVQKAVFGMNSIYRDIDYLLFTHRHTDHFDASYIDEYAVNNNVKGIYIPVPGPDPNSYLEDRRSLRKASTKGKLNEISFEGDIAVSFKLESGINAVYYPMDHLDGKTYPVVNAGILLDIYGKKIFLAADTDHTDRNLEFLIGMGKLNCMFVTPLFIAHSKGRKIIDRIKPEHVVIYHLPDEDDVSGLRQLCEKITSYDYECPVTVLKQEGQIIEL